MDKNINITALLTPPIRRAATPLISGAAYRAPNPQRDLLSRVRNEYLEMPGLSLTLRQVQRMWNARTNDCEYVLDELVGRGFLARTRLGAFVRADSGRAGA